MAKFSAQGSLNIMLNSYYTRDELLEIGFKQVGEDVRISRKSSVYSPEKISIGSHVRIDDFAILSGAIQLGNYIHISAYTALFGGSGQCGITVDDYATLSSRVCVYAETDDYSGACMTNPLISPKYRKVISGQVHLYKHVIIGSGCVVLPGVELKEGAAFGAMALIKHDAESWSINVGIPSHKIKARSQNVKDLEKQFENDSRKE